MSNERPRTKPTSAKKHHTPTSGSRKQDDVTPRSDNVTVPPKNTLETRLKTKKKPESRDQVREREEAEYNKMMREVHEKKHEIARLLVKLKKKEQLVQNLKQ